MSSVYRLLLTTQVTRGRAVALGSIGVIGILIALAIGRSANDLDAGRQFVDGFGLGLLVPTTALVFASAALGDPAEDGTLVYLWLRPLSRFKIVVAAYTASVSVAVPFTVVPTVVAAAVSRGGPDLPLAALYATALATAAYCALFLGLGLVVRRALVWGLAYVLIWEGFVARSGTAAARLSILSYARSLLADVAGAKAPLLAASVPTAIVVPIVVAIAALALTTFALRRVDVR